MRVPSLGLGLGIGNPTWDRSSIAKELDQGQSFSNIWWYLMHSCSWIRIIKTYTKIQRNFLGKKRFLQFLSGQTVKYFIKFWLTQADMSAHAQYVFPSPWPSLQDSVTFQPSLISPLSQPLGVLCCARWLLKA
jgi:hypothetical protein